MHNPKEVGEKNSMDPPPSMHLLILSHVQELTKALRKIKIFKTLTSKEISCLADLMKETACTDGGEILKAGTQSDSLYLVKEVCFSNTIPSIRHVLTTGQRQGEVELKSSETGQSIRVKIHDAFNVEALTATSPVPFAYTAVAVGPVKLLQVSRSAFEGQFGALNKLVEQQQKKKRIGRKWKSRIPVRSVLSRRLRRYN